MASSAGGFAGLIAIMLSHQASCVMTALRRRLSYSNMLRAVFGSMSCGRSGSGWLRRSWGFGRGLRGIQQLALSGSPERQASISRRKKADRGDYSTAQLSQEQRNNAEAGRKIQLHRFKRARLKTKSKTTKCPKSTAVARDPHQQRSSGS